MKIRARVEGKSYKEWPEVEITELTDEQLVDEFASEVDGDTRRISSDGPSLMEAIRNELLRRLKR